MQIILTYVIIITLSHKSEIKCQKYDILSNYNDC